MAADLARGAGAGANETALITPRSGSAIVDGISLSPKNGPEIRSRISIMPESAGLCLRLAVMENLQRFAGLYELDDVRGLVQLLFTPLIAGWSIWAGIAISTRSADVRAAQQLAVLASLPPLGVVALMSFNVIVPTLGLALGLAAGLLIVDVLGWRAVTPMFDRERLVTGTRR